MLLEKIKENSGKILFFVTNILLVVIGVLFFKQKNLQDSLAKSVASQADALNTGVLDAGALDAQTWQVNIAADRQQKLDSVANNPATVTRQETTAVTKTIPSVTRTVTAPTTVTAPVSTNTKSTAPAKTTKTS